MKTIINIYKDLREGTKTPEKLQSYKKLLTDLGYEFTLTYKQGNYIKAELLLNGEKYKFVYGDEYTILEKMYETIIEKEVIKNLVVLVNNFAEFETLFGLIPYLDRKYFDYYYSGEYHLPVLIWNISTNGLSHQGLPNLTEDSDWERYIELIKKAITVEEAKSIFNDLI